jgi:hypothetical protein
MVPDITSITPLIVLSKILIILVFNTLQMIYNITLKTYGKCIFYNKVLPILSFRVFNYFYIYEQAV